MFKVKTKANGSPDNFWARMVALGYTVCEGIDFTYVFAPTLMLATLRIMIVLAAKQKMIVHQMDVSTVFLNGQFQEDVYMSQPVGWEKRGEEHHVCKMKKAHSGEPQGREDGHEESLSIRRL